MSGTAAAGKADFAGSLANEVNPPAPIRTPRVSFIRAWITARLDGDALTVTAHGEASYGLDRTASVSVEVDEGDLDGLRDALADLLAGELDDLADAAEDAAASARRIAIQRGEVL